MTGEAPRPETIKAEILRSWRRCRGTAVSVDAFDTDNLVTPEEAAAYVRRSTAGSFEALTKLCRDLNLPLSYYNAAGKLEYIFNLPGDYPSQWAQSRGFFRDAGENLIGTNSVALALRTGEPYQILGSEHYKLVFRECSCTAAPVYAPDGSLIGAVNYSRTDLNQTEETLRLLYSLARILESGLEGKALDFTAPDSRRSTAGGPRAPRHPDNQACWSFSDIIHSDAQMDNLISIAKRVSLTDTPVIIYGESGSGKELFATAIHNHSRRQSGPFVPINCGAVPENLIESELFGYRPGAFTGAAPGGKKGLLEQASGGTLFLDEIESMPREIQITLLRALSTGSITPLGGLQPVQLDLRVIAASKIDLFEAVIRGQFREDLYYRLNVIDIRIPPLRNRKDDIAPIARKYASFFSVKHTGSPMELDQAYIEELRRHSWPGNVRELKNIVERSIIFNEAGLPDRNVIPRSPGTGLTEEGASKIEQALGCRDSVLARVETLTMERILREEKMNYSRAAKRLGISRQTLYSKCPPSR